MDHLTCSILMILINCQSTSRNPTFWLLQSRSVFDILEQKLIFAQRSQLYTHFNFWLGPRTYHFATCFHYVHIVLRTFRLLSANLVNHARCWLKWLKFTTHRVNGGHLATRPIIQIVSYTLAALGLPHWSRRRLIFDSRCWRPILYCIGFRCSCGQLFDMLICVTASWLTLTLLILILDKLFFDWIGIGIRIIFSWCGVDEHNFGVWQFAWHIHHLRIWTTSNSISTNNTIIWG